MSAKPNEYASRMSRRYNMDVEQFVFLVEEGSDDFEENLRDKNPMDVSPSLKSYIMDNFSEAERKLIKEPKYFYSVTFNKPGGLVMPIIVEYTYADGTTKRETYPAQIWRLNDKEVSKTVASNKEIISIVVDPDLETADIDTSNNSWPKEIKLSDFDKFKDRVKS